MSTSILVAAGADDLPCFIVSLIPHSNVKILPLVFCNNIIHYHHIPHQRKEHFNWMTEHTPQLSMTEMQSCHSASFQLCSTHLIYTALQTNDSVYMQEMHSEIIPVTTEIMIEFTSQLSSSAKRPFCFNSS